jgi:DNA-binding response OmpR family regulator
MRGADTGEAVTARGERDPRSPAGRVLVAEDDANIAEVLVSLLEEEGYAVTVCDDGHAVLTALEQPPGLVMLDVLLPGLNGVEVCRWLKADPRTRDVPVIFVTALGADLLTTRLHGCSYNGIIHKPFTLDAVLAMVRRYLG